MSLVLEVPTAVVAVGEHVTGAVRRAPDGPQTAAVELVWRTGGRCQTEEKVADREEVHFAGAQDAVFRLTVPAGGPMSYDGKSFSIRWCVRLAAEPRVETPLTVTAADKVPEPL